MKLHNVDAEEAAIASMMHGRESCGLALQHLVADDFTSAGRSAIYRAIKTNHDRGLEPDLVTLYHELERMVLPASILDPLDLARIAERVPSGANVLQHVAIVVEMADRRRIAEAADQIRDQARDLNHPVDVLRLPVPRRVLDDASTIDLLAVGMARIVPFEDHLRQRCLRCGHVWLRDESR